VMGAIAREPQVSRDGISRSDAGLHGRPIRESDRRSPGHSLEGLELLRRDLVDVQENEFRGVVVVTGSTARSIPAVYQVESGGTG
jgi:hypothetical protein